ncbi:unnamed protein product [Calypogeia fissa]
MGEPAEEKQPEEQQQQQPEEQPEEQQEDHGDEQQQNQQEMERPDKDTKAQFRPVPFIDYGREKAATTSNQDALDSWPACITNLDFEIVLDIPWEGGQGSPMVWVRGDHTPLGLVEARVVIDLDTPLSEPLPPSPITP